MFRFSLLLVLLFSLSNLQAQIGVPAPPPVEVTDEEVVYTIVEQMPVYQDGGSEGLIKFISSHIVYPDYAIENGIEGTVYINMTVNKEGQLVNIHPIREVHGAQMLTKEAIRVVKLTDGRWIPGKQAGKAVNVSYNLPIKFKLK